MNQKLQHRLILSIGVVSFITFLNLVWLCWFSPEMSIPEEAIFGVWLPSLPAFLFFMSTTIIGISRYYPALKVLLFFSPLLLIYGVMSLSEIEYTLRSHSLFFFQANLYGILQIITAFLIFFSWHYKSKSLY